MRFSFLPLVLIGWPLAEIAGFVLVGRAIGLLATLALVIATSIIGALMLRRQGMQLLRKMSAEGKQGRAPGRAVIDGAMVFVAGILLLLPGFLTDIIGLALFIPVVRKFIWLRIVRRFVVVQQRRTASSSSSTYHYQSDRPTRDGKASGPVVDLDEDDFQRNPGSSSSGPANPASPWAGPKNREP